jgi:hypothetical protein
VVRRAPPNKPNKPSPAAAAADDALLHRLDDVLSEDEIRHVLAAALGGLSDAGRAELLGRLPLETATALGAALSPPPRGTPRAKPEASPGAPVASKGKLRQEWDRLWKQWNAVVEESGRETGKYIEQESHWESAYVATTAVAEDLDAIAAELRPLIPRVIAGGAAPDFSFIEALSELNEDLFAGLPEWLDPQAGDGCFLGPEATSCLLEWEWTVAQRDGRPAPAFLDDLRDLDSGLDSIELDGTTLRAFVLGLSNQDLRALLESMTRQRSSARWKAVFAQAHGCWAEILRQLARRWDPALFAATSRANIDQDWTLALPLVKDAVKRKAHEEAAALIDEALQSLLRFEKNGRWDPRSRLLRHLASSYSYNAGKGPEIAELLRLWQTTAEAQAQADLAAALAVQITALSDIDEGDVMLGALRAVPPQLEQVREALFADVRKHVVNRTLHTSESAAPVPSGGWVGALVDAAWAGRDSATGFGEAVHVALEEARSAPARALQPLYAGWSWRAGPLSALARLTLDLDAASPKVAKAAPRLFELLTAQIGAAPDRLDSTRQAWCKRFGGPSLLPEVLAFWRDNAARFVPDPGHFTGDYRGSADWLAAVHQINPTAAGELLARWVEPHGRKRNLWRDLSARGVPLPAGVASPSKKAR